MRKNSDSIETFHEIAKNNKGKCLSKSYLNQKSKLKFICHAGHTWKATAGTVKGSKSKKGTWCPACSNNSTGSISEMKLLAQKKGGKCLSTKYINSKTNLKWSCFFGHRWNASPSNIKKNNGTWCPYCEGQKGVTINDMQILADRRNGECLSKKYINAKKKLTWKCDKGHMWQATPNHIQSGKWCPSCAGKYKSIADMNLIAKERGGKCLSLKYIDNTTPLKWVCEKEHTWEAKPAGILRGSWCPECSKAQSAKSRTKFTIENLQEIAKQFGGKCLSPRYKSFKNKHLWECSNGHQFEAIYEKVKKGGWCPECKMSKGERICRVALEQIFNKKFPKTRPFWLVNSLGNRAEFDGYCKELNIAYEHHGQYHYKIENYHTKTKQDLAQRKKNDRHKEILAIKNNVKLIVIPEIFTLTPLDKLKTVIREECKRNKIKIPFGFDKLEIDFSKAFLLTDLEDLKLLAISKKGECLAEHYTKSSTKVKWKCEKGHVWEATPNNIKTGTWCPTCAGRNKTIDEMQKLAVKKGGKCLSEKYVLVKEKLLWSCKDGHQWKATPDDIQSGRWCPTCANLHRNDGKKLNIKDIKLFAIKKGGKCLSNVYVSSGLKLKWQCKDGHTWEATTDKVQNKGNWCPECNVKNRADKRRSSIETFKILARKKGGECLTKKYVNSKTKLKYRCKLGHEWEAVPSSIKIGYWCPVCFRARNQKS